MFFILILKKVYVFGISIQCLQQTCARRNGLIDLGLTVRLDRCLAICVTVAVTGCNIATSAGKRSALLCDMTVVAVLGNDTGDAAA